MPLNGQSYYTSCLLFVSRRNIVVSTKTGHYTEDCKDLKKQIEELIRKWKLQKFVKKDVPEQPKYDTRMRSNERPKGECRQQDRPRDVIGEIRAINGGPTARRSFKSLKKSQ